MGAERYEIKELPTNVAAAGAAAVDAGTLAFSGDVVSYEFALAAVNVIGFAAGALVGGPKSATGEETSDLSDEQAKELLDKMALGGNDPEVKNAIPPDLLISLALWLLKRLVK